MENNVFEQMAKKYDTEDRMELDPNYYKTVNQKHY